MSQDQEPYVRDKNPSMDEIRPDPQHLLSLKLHWGLHRKNETLLFYGMIIPCWALEIAAAAMGPYLRSGSAAFIACITAFFVLHWAAWFQTAFAMMQRSSWRRDEEAVEERVQFLWFAVRLQRMMLVCYYSCWVRTCEVFQANIQTANSTHRLLHLHPRLRAERQPG